MPKLCRICVSRTNHRMIERLGKLEVPITTVEQLLEREAGQISEELKVPQKDVDLLRYEVSTQFLQLENQGCGSASITPTTSQLATQASSEAGASMLPFLKGADQIYSEMASKKKAFSTGAASLDELLGEGIHSGFVTELIGQQGTGKTQVCMTAAVVAAEAAAKVVYLDATNSADPRRLDQIAKNRFGEQVVNQVLNNIEIRNVADVYDLLDNLSNLRTLQLTEFQTRRGFLLVVDSVAACLSPLMGGDTKLVPLGYGHGLMATVGQALARCACDLGAAVLIVNNTVGDRDGHRNAVKAALGISWTYTADIKIVLKERAEGILEAALMKHPLKAVGEEINSRSFFCIDQFGASDLILQGLSSGNNV
mmetsp:Transcript_5522/g.7271  ORF Transcript_5522/g.7271 Transcript_5522/m.7271 type:complete len:367 (+) Transcript_5522:144-1244(+)